MHKHMNLSSKPQNPQKSWLWWHMYLWPSTVSGRQVGHWVLLATSPTPGSVKDSVKSIRAENNRAGHISSAMCTGTYTHTPKDGLYPFYLPPSLSTPNLKATERYRLGKGCVNTGKGLMQMPDSENRNYIKGHPGAWELIHATKTAGGLSRS